MGDLLFVIALIVVFFIWKDFKKLKSPSNDSKRPNQPSRATSEPSNPSDSTRPLLLKGEGHFGIRMAGAEHHADALRKAFQAKIRAARKEWEEMGEEIEDSDCEHVDTTVTLVLEDTNPHDSNAVAVMVRDNLIGYLPRSIAPLYRDYLNRNGLQGQQCRCKAEASIPLHPSGDDWQVALDLPNLAC